MKFSRLDRLPHPESAVLDSLLLPDSRSSCAPLCVCAVDRCVQLSAPAGNYAGPALGHDTWCGTACHPCPGLVCADLKQASLCEKSMIADTRRCENDAPTLLVSSPVFAVQNVLPMGANLTHEVVMTNSIRQPAEKNDK